jgi:hypothetical protein
MISQLEISAIKDFVKERDEMLMACDVEKMKAFHAKHNPHVRPSPSDDVAWLSLHKARTGAKSLPMEARVYSYNWLKARGSSSLDDGDVAAAANGEYHGRS